MQRATKCRPRCPFCVSVVNVNRNPISTAFYRIAYDSRPIPPRLRSTSTESDRFTCMGNVGLFPQRQVRAVHWLVQEGIEIVPERRSNRVLTDDLRRCSVDEGLTWFDMVWGVWLVVNSWCSINGWLMKRFVIDRWCPLYSYLIRRCWITTCT